MQRVIHITGLVCLVLLVLSCAKQNAAGPSGGPKDETPPRVVKSNPENKTVNFTQSLIEITFDEYFVLDNVDQKLMISPPFEEKPKIETKGKTLSINFEEDLRDSITYTFYFMDAVKDLNENNPIENFQYVFSTGPTLDSLSVTGTIYDAATLEPGENIFVMLYSNLDDTVPTTILPDYITRAGEDGRFRIDNIAEGIYSVFGLIDLNNNKIYDLVDESIAFLDSTITLNGPNNFIPPMPDSLATAADSARYLTIPGKEYRLYYFTAENKNQYLTSTDRDNAYKLTYTFRQPVDSGQFLISFLDTTDVNYSLEVSPNRDTMTIWLLDSVYYIHPNISVKSEYPKTDSTGAIVIKCDTINFRYTTPRLQRGRSNTKEKGLQVNHNAAGRTGFKPGQNLKFSFETPVKEPDTSLIKLYLVVDTNLVNLEYTISRDSTSDKKIQIEQQFIEDSTYLLMYDRGAFTDIFEKKNDSTGLKFKVRNAESYGTLTMRLSGYKGNLIVQLLGSDKKLVREDKIILNETGEIYYPLLEKGDYKLKAIFDLNGDGKWTTGEYDKKIQPEPVTFFSNIIEIKVQWDLVLDWEIKKLNNIIESLNSNSNKKGELSNR